MGVDVWTDRGKDAVYEPGEPVEIKVRVSTDAYVLVYDIDSEGYVRVLYPYEQGRGFVEGRHTYRVPPYESGLQLVVQGPVGQGYIVAVASREPFDTLPWYLRPYDPQAEGVGYVGDEEDQEEVLSDGRIVGDPFVAMERIRRKVLYEPNDSDAFATAYTSYYVHQPVRYPRYLCNDCHRPGYWAWWDGWDPYYTSCSAFHFRVYWGWSWGPRYWFGTVPYFCYVPRCYPCSPYDRPWYSGWHGWRRWTALWDGPPRRYKSRPPTGYTPPGKYAWSRWKEGKPLPPGFLAAEYVKGAKGVRMRVPIGANRPTIEVPGQRPRPGSVTRPSPVIKPDATRAPAQRPRDGGVRYIRPQREARPVPGRAPASGEGSRPRIERSREGPRPASPPRYEKPRSESRPAPQKRAPEVRKAPAQKQRAPQVRSAPAPRQSAPAPRPAPSRGSSGKSDGGKRRGAP
jgi:hypothetical protein